jgi:glutamate dehydrogenase/leucine dehydrogenase
VLHALHAVAHRLWGDRSLADRHVAISGVGKVGADLARQLAAAGARLTIADVRADVAGALGAELGATVVAPDAIAAVECDVLSPCALGALLDAPTIAALQCAAVCGCANNQLATDDDGDRLAERGVLYAPDYVVNAGGVMNIAQETAPGGYDHARAWSTITTIEATLSRVFTIADEHGTTPADAADHLAEARIAAATSSSQPS